MLRSQVLLDAGKSSLVPSRKTCGKEDRRCAGVFFGELIEADCSRERACHDRLLWVDTVKTLFNSDWRENLGPTPFFVFFPIQVFR
jgi:hypothetical protein